MCGVSTLGPLEDELGVYPASVACPLPPFAAEPVELFPTEGVGRDLVFPTDARRRFVLSRGRGAGQDERSDRPDGNGHGGKGESGVSLHRWTSEVGIDSSGPFTPAPFHH